jgi:anthranilate synthase component 2
MTARLLVIDNYDSFTFNLVQMFLCYDIDIQVFRSDRILSSQAAALMPDYLLVSPGPRDPAHAGNSIALIRDWYRHIPILGVCLGMQCLNEAFGGKTVRAPEPRHGKVSRVQHCQTGLFQGMPNPFAAARYHSLAVAPCDNALRVTATSDDGVIMGLSHPDHPAHGVQFHPESFMTEAGASFVANFLRLGPLGDAACTARGRCDAQARLTIHHELQDA